MKKTYSKPEVLLVKIQLSQMIALSELGVATDKEVLGREGDYWDDEE